MPVSRPPASAAPGRRVVLVGAIALAVLLGLLPTPATAEDDPAEPRTATPEQVEARDATLALRPEEPASPDDRFGVLAEDRTAEAAAAVVRLVAEQASADADRALVLIVVDRDAKSKVEAAAQQERDAAAADLALQRERLSQFTVRAYVTGGELNMEEYRALVQGDTTDPEAGRRVMFDQVMERQQEVTDAARAKANKTRKALVVARQALAAAEDAVKAATAQADQRHQEKDAAVTAHQDAVAAVANAETALRRAPTGQLVPEGVSLIGAPKLTAEDLAGWFRTTTYSPRVATPIEDYARWFIEEGNAEGIRGDIAFAQAVLETGGFANNDSVLANNFSGIGHCDLCPSGWRFPSPRMGVRAQIQLLKSYAVRQPEYANDLVDKRLRGPAGCCPTWGDLTTVWATDPTYAPKVMLIYSGIVDYAIGRRHAGQGFDDPLPAVPEP